MSKASVQIEIKTLSEADLPDALDTLVQAFADDPVATHLFPDPWKRPAGMAHIFRMALRYGQKYGRVDVSRSSGAVAVWARPEYAAASWTRLARAGYLATPFKLGWSATRRMLRFEDFIKGCRRRTLDVSHWYLFSIGVRPDRQGHGLGAALLQHGLGRALTTGLPCYLETANARNLPFYQKHGFRAVGDKHLPDVGPGVWSLVAGGIRDERDLGTGL